MSLVKWTLKELQDRFTRGDVSATEIVRSYFLRISVVESKVNAYVTVNGKESLLSAARTLDETMGTWRKTMPMMAMPIAVKDNICTEGLPTTCGSRMLRGFTPPYDATAVEALRAHQCFVIGKTNLDEFGMGSSTEHSAFGPSRNPWKLACVPGGSSGGSAAAVAADECVAALGTDTGGLDSSTRGVLRGRRLETDVWPGIPLWADCVCLLAGSDRADYQRRDGRRVDVERDCRP